MGLIILLVVGGLLGWGLSRLAAPAAARTGPALRLLLTRRPLVGGERLLGAAHPMTPNAGQGACQALDDAVALGDSFKDFISVTEAFGLYEGRRRRRANRVVAMSRQSTRSVQIDNAVLCGLRDNFGRLLPHWLLLKMLDAAISSRPSKVGDASFRDLDFFFVTMTPNSSRSDKSPATFKQLANT